MFRLTLKNCRVYDVTNLNEKITEGDARIIQTKTLPVLTPSKAKQIVDQVTCIAKEFQALKCNTLAVSTKTDILMYGLLVSGILNLTKTMPNVVFTSFNQKDGGYKLSESPLDLSQFSKTLEL